MKITYDFKCRGLLIEVEEEELNEMSAKICENPDAKSFKTSPNKSYYISEKK
ncbi:MAG: hypothetical protein GY795_01260 [Desulfobacterales bacterium]|nr:hypothetical protein [Desulfobacterales bacterium]